MTMRNFLLLISFLGTLALCAQDTPTGSSDFSDVRETLRQSLGALRMTYTADIEFDVPDLAEVTTKPTISYKQRVFEDGTSDVQADLENLPLPDDVPSGMRELSFGFLHTAEGNALRLGDEAVMRNGQADEEDPLTQMLNQLNEIPVPTDEELAAIDLRQETTVIDGVECQVLSWIPEEYEADNPESVAMHCVAFGTDDHLLRSYTALNDKGEEMFSMTFKNVNSAPTFGPEDFTFGPQVKITHVNTDEEFENEIKKLFMKKFIQNAMKPKSKRPRRTASTKQPSTPDLPEEKNNIPENTAPTPTATAVAPSDAKPPYGRIAVLAGLLLALAITGVLYYLQKRRQS